MYKYLSSTRKRALSAIQLVIQPHLTLPQPSLLVKWLRHAPGVGGGVGWGVGGLYGRRPM